MEKIFFKNSNGKYICGSFTNNNSDTVILLCHGLGSHKNQSVFFKYQKKIDALGLSVLSIDLIGHGESDGESDDLTLTETIDNIICAKKELHNMGYNTVGFIGHSFGGVGGIMAAATVQFKFLVLVSPPTYYDISEMISSWMYVLKKLHAHNKLLENKNKAHIRVSFFKDYGSHDSYAAAEKINAPVLIIQGDKDKMVPVEKSKLLRKHIKGSKIKIFKGAGHNYGRPEARKRLIEEVIKFVEENK